MADHEITPKGKSGVGPGLVGLPKFCGSSLVFVQRLKLATSNLACRWGWPRPTIKTTTRKKWAWPWTRKAPKYLGFPFNIFATAASNSALLKNRLYMLLTIYMYYSLYWLTTNLIKSCSHRFKSSRHTSGKIFGYIH